MSVTSVLRSKRGLVQLIGAILVASVCAAGSIAVVYSLFVGFANTQEQNRKQASHQVKQLQAELEQLKVANSNNPDKMAVPQVQATQPIRLGQLIERTQITLVDVPKSQAMTDSFHSVMDVLGRVAVADIPEGTFVRAQSVSQPSNASHVGEGYRAVSISVDSVGGIAGSVMPGSYVDVMVTATAGSGQPNNAPQPVTKTVLQRVRVLEVARATATGNNAAVNNSGNALVTLAVLPQQGEILALAQQMGKFHLALRGYGDTSVARLPGSRWQQIVSTGSPPKPAVRVYNPPPSLPSFDELMRRQGTTAGNMAALGPMMGPAIAPVTATPYQMEVVKGANSEWVTLQAR